MGSQLAACTLSIASLIICVGISPAFAIDQGAEPSTESQSSTETTTPTTPPQTSEPSASPSPSDDGLRLLGVEAGGTAAPAQPAQTEPEPSPDQ